MALIIFSVALSLSIAGFAVAKGRSLFGAYAAAIERVKNLAAKLDSCAEGVSFQEVLTGWVSAEERTVRGVARSLFRILQKEPIEIHGRLGWVVDFENLCDGKRFFRMHASYGLAEAMPGLLTGIGILFTFAGLTVGVYGLDPTDADQLTAGVSRLLGGMSLAFLTSISGIAAALWWNWRFKQVALDFDQSFDTLAEALHAKPFLFNPEEMNYQILEFQKVQSEAMADLEERVYRGIHRALEQSYLRELKDTVANALGGARSRGKLTDALESLRQHMIRIAGSVAESAELNRKTSGLLEKLSAAPGGLAGGMPASPEGQAKLVTQETQRTLANIGQIQQAQDEAHQSIRESARELRRLMEQARNANADIIKNHQSILQHVQRLDQHWETYRDKLASMEDTLRKSLGEFRTVIHRSLEGVHGEFDRLLAESLQHFAGAIKSFEDALQGLAMARKQEETQKKSWLNRRKP